MSTVGFLHPGQMGVSLMHACATDTVWASQGRSNATIDRASGTDAVDVETVASVVERADVIVSICPPASAVGVARDVGSLGFDGLYVDANAISPATMAAVASELDQATVVDGSVIGPPALRPGTTRLYLSGPSASSVAGCFTDTNVDARVISDNVGAASALKMAYASWTKIGAALQLAIRSLADQHGVGEALVDEWNVSQPGLADRTEVIANRIGPKAWRFEGEMREIAASFRDLGLPDGFGDGAAELYAELAGFKDADAPTLDAVLDALRAANDG